MWKNGTLASAGDRLGQQGLAGAWHAHQQHPLGDARSHLGELTRILEKLDDFLEFVLGLVLAGHVGKVDLLGGLHVTLGAALAERESAIAAALDLPEHEPDEEESEHPREEIDEHPQGRHVARPAGDLNRLLLQFSQQLGIGVGNGSLEKLAWTALELPLDFVPVDDLDRLHHVLVQVVQKHRIGDFLGQRSLVVNEEKMKKTIRISSVIRATRLLKLNSGILSRDLFCELLLSPLLTLPPRDAGRAAPAAGPPGQP